MATECDPAAVLDGGLPADVYMNRLSLNEDKPKKRSLDVAIFDQKLHATTKKRSSRTPAEMRDFAYMKAVFIRISKAPHHHLHAELEDAVEKDGLEKFLARVIDHPEVLETVPRLPRKPGVPRIFNHPDLLGTIAYIMDRKKEGPPPNPELLETILNYMAKKKQGLA